MGREGDLRRMMVMGGECIVLLVLVLVWGRRYMDEGLDAQARLRRAAYKLSLTMYLCRAERCIHKVSYRSLGGRRFILQIIRTLYQLEDVNSKN